MALVALAVLLAGCRVDALVTVDVRDDGGGTVGVEVALDPAAVQAVEAGGGAIDERVRLDDLRAAGWDVSEWERSFDGSATVRLSKGFADSEELGELVEELNGPDGPLRDLSLTRERSVLRTDYRLEGEVDLSALAAGVASDPELVEQLTGLADPTGIEEQLTADLREALSLEVTARLPSGAERSWRPAAGERVRIELSSTVAHPKRLGLLALGGVLALAAIVLLVVGEARGRRRRRGGRLPSGSRVS
ncbi:MAG: hypothetical protein M5U14_18305 [Acidimicrobiia bacterium]|nr:hypothetical protein [Acidimicrobiia bacterium]